MRGNLKVLKDTIETSVKVVPYVRRIQRIRRILGNSTRNIAKKGDREQQITLIAYYRGR